MRKILEDFYYGNLTPGEKRMKPGSELQRAVNTAAQCEEQLAEGLGETGCELLTKLVTAQHEIDSITAAENFILGFRLGIRLMAEYMDENDGDIRNGGEWILAKKRANGEGNIRKRKDGRWEGRYTAGYNPETGKRIIKNVLGKTQSEVEEKLAQAQQETAGLDVSRSEDYTVTTWLRSWYKLYAKPNVRPATADRYQLIIETYPIPRIGKIKLNKLTSRDLQKFYKDLMEQGRVQKRSGKGNPGLSSTTVRSVHLTLHCAFERALKERLIPRNPTDDCIAPKVQKVEMKTLLPERLKSYLDAANARDVLPMFYLELVSGLRKGELVALLWSDLDVARQTISVSKQYVRNPSGEVILSSPKTETSVRQVSIPQDAVDLLIQEHDSHPDNPYMFPSPVTGEMYHPDSVVKLHEKIPKDAGLEHISFHALRHTFATLALQNGVDVKTVSSMLGHYDAGFTLRTYTHATRQMQTQAAETIKTEKTAKKPGRKGELPVWRSLSLSGPFHVGSVENRKNKPTKKFQKQEKSRQNPTIQAGFWSCYPDLNWGFPLLKDIKTGTAPTRHFLTPARRT